MKSEAQAAFEAAKEQAEAARELFRSQGQPNNIQVVMPPPTDGERAVHRAEKVAYLLAGLFLASLVMVWQQSERISEMSARHEAHAAWAREESNIMRGYIWTGKVPPINKYPEPKK